MPKRGIVTGVIVCLTFSIGLIGCAPPDSEVTVYPVQCKGILRGRTCSGKLLPLNRTVYRVSVARQDIVYWMPGFELLPNRLVNCVVRNRRNWTGEYEDGSGGVRMVNGKFQTWPSYPDTIYVEWWRWWFLYLVY